MRHPTLRAWATTVVLSVSTLAFADVYTDGTLTVDLTFTGNANAATAAGKFTLGGQDYPATATQSGNSIAGTFKASGADFKFDGTLNGDTLTLTSGGKSYTLKNTRPAANPLAGGGPAAAQPGAAGGAGNALPAGYVVAGTDDKGIALRATKPQVKSVQEALSGSVPDVAKVMDAPPTLVGAVEDQKTHKSGAAVLNGTRNGKPVRGVVSCQLTDAGAELSVVLADPDAPQEVWQKLTAAKTPVTDAASKVPMHDYPFPDGTGTIGLPDGWTTRAGSLLDTIEVDGPDGAKVFINGSIFVNTPDCQMVQLYKQLASQAQRMGMAPPPPPPGLFAPYAAPVEALQSLLPQINAFNRQQNLPTGDFGKMIDTQPAPPQMPNGRAQLMEYTWTLNDAGHATPMHSICRDETASFGRDAWMLGFTELAAPADKFAALQPAMFAILNGQKPNQEQINRLTQQRNQAMQQQIAQTAANNRQQLQNQFDAGQAAHKQQIASYDAYNHNWAVNENLKSRSNDNFVEYLGGTRDVVDTHTGQRTSVDLNSAAGIVDSLNANDPGRYGQLPLRDLNHPLTGP